MIQEWEKSVISSLVLRGEMTELFSEVLKANLLEGMKALTSTLQTCLQSVDNRISVLDDKVNMLITNLEELMQSQSVSKSTTERALSDMSQSVRETGIGMQRVIDKQELVDAHLLLSKLQKETETAKEEVRNTVGTENTPKTSAKSKDAGDAGGPSEPNPPSPVTAGNASQMKQDVRSESAPMAAPIPSLQTMPSVSGPESQVAWRPATNMEPSAGHAAPPRVSVPPPSMPAGHPAPRESQDLRQMYNPGQDARKEMQPQYEVGGRHIYKPNCVKWVDPGLFIIAQIWIDE